MKGSRSVHYCFPRSHSSFFAGSTAAQDKSPALLNSLEVQQLVKRAEPADSARLAAHFTALGERYEAEATRHTSMAQSFVGNPRCSLGTGRRAHCNSRTSIRGRRLSCVTSQPTTAAGAAAVVATTGTRFEGGTGARTPTVQELDVLGAKASTPADHHSLEECFLTLAKRYTADATPPQRIPYRGTKIAQAAVHCDSLVRLSKAAGKEATDVAAMQKQLAVLAGNG
jgi:hypothetical protein